MDYVAMTTGQPIGRHGVRVLDLVPGRHYTPACRVWPLARGNPMAPTSQRGADGNSGNQRPITPGLTGGQKMDFGWFMMPFHPPRRSLADAYDRDTAFLVQADQLGAHEAWMGEPST